MASTSATTTKLGASEDILGHKTDLALSNGLVKTGTGFAAGVLLSALLFRRRAFPVWLGTGIGMGSAYSDAQRIFNPAAIPGYKVANTSAPGPSPAAVPARMNAPSTATTPKLV